MNWVPGAGFSGPPASAACAASLARRGWQVSLIDAVDGPAGGASALPAGLLAPHVSPDDSLLWHADVAADGSGVVKGKVWPKDQPEPQAWTIEAKVARAHTQGSPGIFGFTPMNQKRVFLDNLSITENK